MEKRRVDIHNASFFHRRSSINAPSRNSSTQEKKMPYDTSSASLSPTVSNAITIGASLGGVYACVMIAVILGCIYYNRSFKRSDKTPTPHLHSIVIANIDQVFTLDEVLV